MSAFDPNSFLDATISEPTERRIPLPVECPGSSDGCYVAVIKDAKARAWDSKKADAKIKAGIAWDVQLEMQIPQEIQDGMKYQSTFTLTDGFIVDLNDQGMIDNSAGKNRRMRVYREAVDLNKTGDVFSAKKLLGKMVRVKLKHRLYENSVFEEVDNILKA